MSVKDRKLLLIIAFTFRTMFVNTSQIAGTWTRDQKLDDVIKVSVLPHQEVAARTAVHCGCLCSLSLSCFSFFFVPSGRCLLNEFVLTNPDGGQPSPGAMYFRRNSVHCPVNEGFVGLLDNKLCIKVYPNSRTTFPHAYGECTRVGARLVVLDTIDKINAVLTYIENKYRLTEYFIGAMREGVLTGTRTTWDKTLHPLYWLDGNKVATSGPDWDIGNPDNYDGIEGCLQVKRWKFNDLSCNSTQAFVCEKVLA